MSLARTVSRGSAAADVLACTSTSVDIGSEALDLHLPGNGGRPCVSRGSTSVRNITSRAIVGEDGAILTKATRFGEDAEGYERVRTALGDPAQLLVAMEATGHYWQNLFAVLAAHGYQVALLNPLRTSRFAGEEMARTKTDAIDAVGIARFAQQKRPAATAVTDEVTVELRELVLMRERLVQELGDKVRQLHRVVDLGFPEFTRHVKKPP